MNVSGCALANAWTAPGHRGDGHERARDERERHREDAEPLRSLRVAAHEPEQHEHERERQRVHDEQHRCASAKSATVVFMRKPMMKPTPSVTSPTSTISAASAIARPASTARVGDRAANATGRTSPDATSSATATDDPPPVKSMPGHDEAGDEELDVGDAADADRAAEDVAEHQQEHDALHDRDAEHLRRAQQLAGGAAGDRERGRRPARRCGWGRGSSVHAACSCCLVFVRRRRTSVGFGSVV